MQLEQKNKIQQDLQINIEQYQQQDENQSSDDSDSEPEIGIISDEDNQPQSILNNKSFKFIDETPKTSQLKKRNVYQNKNSLGVGQSLKKYNFHTLTRGNSQIQRTVHQTISIKQSQSPSLGDLNKINRNLSSHIINNNADAQDRIQSCRVLRQSIIKTPKEFKLKSEARVQYQGPNDKHIIFEQNLKIKRKNTQAIKLF